MHFCNKILQIFIKSFFGFYLAILLRFPESPARIKYMMKLIGIYLFFSMFFILKLINFYEYFSWNNLTVLPMLSNPK